MVFTMTHKETKRDITYIEELVYRLCSPDFCGLTRQQAAQASGHPYSWVCTVLSNLERKAPQLFPILTVRQNLIKICVSCLGWDRDTVSFVLGLSLKSIDNTIRELRKKGTYIARPKAALQYVNWMDNAIKHRY